MKSQNIKVIAKPKFGVTNNRNSILYEYLERSGIVVDELTLKNMLLNKYDIFHMHWPDRILSSHLFVLKIALFYLLCLTLRLKKIKVVYTVHNPSPKLYYRSWHKKLYFSVLNECVDAYVFPSLYARDVWGQENPAGLLLNKFQRIIPLGLQNELVEKGSCRPIGFQLDVSREKFLLFVGRFTTDKNFPMAVSALLQDQIFDSFKIVVAGAPKEESVVSQLQDIARVNKGRVKVIARFLSDEEINWLIESCFAVMINYKAVNSGVATLAIAHGTDLVVYDEAFKLSLESTYGACKIHNLQDLRKLILVPSDKLIQASNLKTERLTIKEVSDYTAKFYKELIYHG